MTRKPQGKKATLSGTRLGASRRHRRPKPRGLSALIEDLSLWAPPAQPGVRVRQQLLDALTQVPPGRSGFQV